MSPSGREHHWRMSVPKYSSLDNVDKTKVPFLFVQNYVTRVVPLVCLLSNECSC